MEDNVNILDILEDLFNNHGLSYRKQELVCDGRLKAAFILNDKVIVDCSISDFAYFEKDNQR